MAEAMALTAAVCFGLVHFFSGLLSRKASSYAIALTGQVGGMALVLVAASIAGASDVGVPALAWGALSGLGTGIGVTYLYRGISKGRMSVVVPLSDVAAVALPVLFGVAILGDAPTFAGWCGIVVAVPALWLVTRQARPAATTSSTGTVDGLIAGAGFALQFIAISRVGPAAGLWPVLAARVTAVATIAPLAMYAGAQLKPRGRLIVPALLVGSLGSVGITLYLVATQQHLLALVTVLTALYPVIPVVLAFLVLRERPSKAQRVGLACAAAAIALITLGS